MKHTFRKTVVTASLLACGTLAFSQKKFSVSIIFPKELDMKKVQISYDAGHGIQQIAKNDFLENKIPISDKLYSEFARVIIHIDNNRLELPVYSTFYIADKPAAITYVYKNPLSSFRTLQLKNVYNTDTISREFASYIQTQFNNYIDFNNSSANGTLKLNDSISFARHKEVARALINRELMFIAKYHDKSPYYEYFSFIQFKDFVAINSFTDPDKAIPFYHSTFLRDIRNSYEGKEVSTLLEGRFIAAHNDVPARMFKADDIYGHPINLKQEHGKYVLINLWATWCVPCMAEMPIINKIRKEYSPSQLKIISIDADRDSLNFIKAVKQNKMTWTQVYNDKRLIDLYGGDNPLPKLYLVNKAGIIIYNRNQSTDRNSVRLEVLQLDLKRIN